MAAVGIGDAGIDFGAAAAGDDRYRYRSC